MTFSRPYRVLEATPGVAEYIKLREVCGLGIRHEDAARTGLGNSLFSVCLRDGVQLIGMGRVIGDGGCFTQIVDIAVHPDWQRRGLGREIVGRLVAWCHASLPETCYVSLIADPGAVELYRAFGFVERPPDGPGMSLARD